MACVQRFFMFRYILVILAIVLVPVLGNAAESKRNYLSGTWFIYGFALYQPITRTVSTSSNKQIIYDIGFNYGIGLGKDNLRIEVTKYMDKPRFLAAFDIFPKYIATPYIGYVYGRALRIKDNSGVLKFQVEQGDAVLGISFQPIRFFSVYTEYLIREKFFFAGARVRLPYTVK